jgi:hypothetical protein
LVFHFGSSFVRASSWFKSRFSIVGFHFGRILRINIFAVSIHFPGCSQPNIIRSWYHDGQPQLLRPIPDGFTIWGFRAMTVLRLAILRASRTIRTPWFDLRHAAASRWDAFLYRSFCVVSSLGGTFLVE